MRLKGADRYLQRCAPLHGRARATAADAEARAVDRHGTYLPDIYRRYNCISPPSSLVGWRGGGQGGG